MNSFRGYLIHICSVSFFTALVLTVTPEGTVRRIAKFIGALLLILTVVKPVASLDTEDLAQALSKYQMQAHQDQTGVTIQSRSVLEQVIKQRCEAYISDKAEELDIEVLAEITLNEGGDYPYPIFVVLHADVQKSDQDHLENIISRDLGIPRESQEWK